MTHLTDDQIAHLKSEHAKGTPYSRIGADLGVSRNAISGQIHRMGMSVPFKDRQPRPIKPRPPRVRVHQKPIFGRVVEPIDAVDIPPPSIEDAARDRASLKTLVELEPGECKWPVNEGSPYLFCASHALDGHPYCGPKHHNHCKRAYNPGAYKNALRPYVPQRGRG